MGSRDLSGTLLENVISIILPLSIFKVCSPEEAEIFFFNVSTRQSNENDIKGGFKETELKPCLCHFTTLHRTEYVSASMSSLIRQES